MTTRAKAARVIREVMQAHPELHGPALMDLLRAAYPFGEKMEGLPYRRWRQEVQAALGVPRRKRR